MKLGYLFYWCGWGAIVVSVALLIMGFTIADDLIPAIAKSISGFIIGGLFVGIGTKKIARAKQQGNAQRAFGQLQKESQEQFTTFQKENCVGCRFADEEAMRNGQKWCTRPEPPEISKDNKWCYSREVAKG
jgi:cytochrome c1